MKTISLGSEESARRSASESFNQSIRSIRAKVSTFRKWCQTDAAETIGGCVLLVAFLGTVILSFPFIIYVFQN